MKELRIELPSYEGREPDEKTIAMLAEKNDLDYRSSKVPYMTVFDDSTNEALMKANGEMRCYVSGPEENISKFLEEMNDWITKF